jgi:hypothetical protein
MVAMLLGNASLDSVRSIGPAPATPYKMWTRTADGLLSPVADAGFAEAYNAPRQLLPEVFLHNGAIDVVRTTVITEGRSMTGSRIYGFVSAADVDIDHEAEFIEADVLASPKVFCFDIDGVIATQEATSAYDKARPQSAMIAVVNDLYDAGHTVILCTARGSLTGIDWTDVTKAQLLAWGVKHHQLVFGKPAADFYIDDRMLSTQDAALLVARLAARRPTVSDSQER